jgi:hypothetical protein
MNIYRLALQVQDASNPAGVINSLAREVLPAIQAEPGYKEQGTQYLAEHPVLLLFLDKLVSLTHKGFIHDHDLAISDAYSVCHEMIEAEDSAEAELAAGLDDCNDQCDEPCWVEQVASGEAQS